MDVGNQEPLSVWIPRQAVGLRPHGHFPHHVARSRLDHEDLSASSGGGEHQIFPLSAQDTARFRTARNRATVDASFTIDDLDGPHRGMRDKRPSRLEIHVAMIESARRMARQVDPSC
jgi:hypothetical protein